MAQWDAANQQWVELDSEGRAWPVAGPAGPAAAGSLTYDPATWRNHGAYFAFTDPATGKTRYAIPQTENWLQPNDPVTGAAGVQTWVSGDRNQGQVANFQTPGAVYDVSGLPSHPSLGGTWNQAAVSDTAPTVGAYKSENEPFGLAKGAPFWRVAPFFAAAAAPFVFGGAAGAAGAGAAEGAGGAMMPAAVPESAATLQSWGLEQIAPGVWQAPSVGGALMPPAVPETAETLRGWGLQETAPGRWELPAGSQGAEQFRAPVEERTPSPNGNGGNSYLPNLGNAAATAARAAGAGANTAGAVGNGVSTLANIKDTLSLTSAVGNVLRSLNLPSVGETGATLARASDGARRRVVQQNLDQINDAFKGFDENYYNSIAEAFKNYYQPQVTRNFDTATENIIYAAPGGVGSSAYARKLAEAERDRQQAGTEVSDAAQTEALNARKSIEGTKANLFGLAEASEDPGAFGAQAVAGAQASSYTPQYSAIGDLVSRYATLANAAGQLEAGGYGRTGVRPLTFGSSRGGSSAYRNIT